MCSIHAIVVTYFPAMESFASHIAELLRQVDVVHIIDNTDAEDERVLQILSPMPDRIRLVRLGKNLGIAKALNAGVNNALNEGATHILTLDQDSLISAGMVEKLLSVTQELMKKGGKVAAVAPVYFDAHRNIAKPFQQIRARRIAKIFPPSDLHTVYSEVLTVITSGGLYPKEVFQTVGGFEEGLFVDHVDNEWCFRVQARGFKVYCCWQALMNHQLGVATITIPMTKRQITLHSPVRNYYFFRNAVSLFKRDYVPFLWKIFILNDLLSRFIVAVIFCPPRISRLRLILLGTWHGLMGRMGKLTSS